MRHQFLTIEGNIGSGKTSLATMLSKEFNTRLILEEFDDNPFLPLFYKDAERYAFPLELSFLAERFHQLKKILPENDLFQPQIISDYLFNKCLVFAKSNLEEQEYHLYSQLFDIIHPNLPTPNLLVYLYLKPENSLKNIAKRGREYEQEIPISYLEKIQEGYLNYFKQHQDLSILLIDTNNIDFVNNPNDYAKIKEVIDQNYPTGINRVIL